MQKMPVPSVGRVVHYLSRGSADGRFPPEARAAIVTEVSGSSEYLVGLAVFNPTGIFLHSLDSGGAIYGDQPGEWTWPPRV